jgi:hypothetical protein
MRDKNQINKRVTESIGYEDKHGNSKSHAASNLDQRKQGMNTHSKHEHGGQSHHGHHEHMVKDFVAFTPCSESLRYTGCYRLSR